MFVGQQVAQRRLHQVRREDGGVVGVLPQPLDLGRRRKRSIFCSIHSTWIRVWSRKFLDVFSNPNEGISYHVTERFRF